MWAVDSSLYLGGFGALYLVDLIINEFVKTQVPGIHYENQMQISPDGHFAIWPFFAWTIRRRKTGDRHTQTTNAE